MRPDDGNDNEHNWGTSVADRKAKPLAWKTAAKKSATKADAKSGKVKASPNSARPTVSVVRPMGMRARGR